MSRPIPAASGAIFKDKAAREAKYRRSSYWGQLGGLEKNQVRRGRSKIQNQQINHAPLKRKIK